MTDIDDAADNLDELEDLEPEEADAQNVKGGATQEADPHGRGDDG